MDNNLEAKLVYSGSWTKNYDQEYNLVSDVTIIGRAGDIRIPYDSVTYTGEGYDDKGALLQIRTSRLHARIIRKDGKYIIEDLGSEVGTYVNGVKLGEEQPEPWKVRFCHSGDYYTARKPLIRERNKGSVDLKDGDVITLGKEMYDNKHEFVFKVTK